MSDGTEQFRECPDCGGKLEYDGFSATDGRGRLQESYQYNCSDCGGIEDMDGNWISEKEQEKHMRQMEKERIQGKINRAQTADKRARAARIDGRPPHRSKYSKLREKAFNLRQKARAHLRSLQADTNQEE